MKKESRRKFVQSAALGLVLTGAATDKVSATIKTKETFVHHVYFWLKNPHNEADKAKLIEGLEKLAKVPQIKMAHIGIPASTNRSVIDRSYAVSWLLFFENIEDEEIYQKHPIHLKFIEENSHLWEKVIVYDSVGKKV